MVLFAINLSCWRVSAIGVLYHRLAHLRQSVWLYEQLQLQRERRVEQDQRIGLVFMFPRPARYYANVMEGYEQPMLTHTWLVPIITRSGISLKSMSMLPRWNDHMGPEHFIQSSQRGWCAVSFRGRALIRRRQKKLDNEDSHFNRYSLCRAIRM